MTTPPNTSHKQDKPASLGRSGSIVAIMTLLSRVLGFVRDQVLAIVFGAGATTDVFLVAFKIPNFLRRLFAEGAFAQAFIPVFTEYRETGDKAALRELAAHVVGTLTVILLVITTLCVMFAPFIVMLFAPGFVGNPEQFELATHMLRITFPYLLAVSLVAYAGSILNTFGQFAIPSLTPVLLNICMISAALFVSPWFDKPIVALAWGVFAAGVLQLALQIPFLQRLGLLPKPRWGWKHSGVRRILKLMAPAIVGSSVAQINLLLDTVIATFLVSGSLSWLYYSDRLMEFPLGLIGVTLGTIILPRLSREYTNNAEAGYRNTITWALRITILLALPATVGLITLAGPLLTTLFEYGAFTAKDTYLSSFSLVAYSIGIPAFVVIKIFAPAFFARQDTKTPVRIGIVALISNMVYNLLFVLPMVWLEFIAPHTGLALATTASAVQQAWMLYRELHKRGLYNIDKALVSLLLRTLPALIAMGIALLVMQNIDWHILTASERVTRLLTTIVVGAGTYAVALLLCGVRPNDLKSP